MAQDSDRDPVAELTHSWSLWRLALRGSRAGRDSAAPILLAAIDHLALARDSTDRPPPGSGVREPVAALCAQAWDGPLSPAQRDELIGYCLHLPLEFDELLRRKTWSVPVRWLRLLALVALAACALLTAWLYLPVSEASYGLVGVYSAWTEDRRPMIATRIDPSVELSPRTGGPPAPIPDEHFSVAWSGQLRAPVAGRYYFRAEIRDSDSVRVAIGGEVVVNRQSNADAAAGVAYLAEGLVSLRVDYQHADGPPALSLWWEGPDFDLTAVGPGHFIPVQATAERQ